MAISRRLEHVGVAMYRIVQEALANAARHAPPACTALGIELGDGRVSLVADTVGPVNDVPASEPGRRRYGLIGMGERATALGGELTAGPTGDGWRVSCRLPLQPPDADADADADGRSGECAGTT